MNNIYAILVSYGWCCAVASPVWPGLHNAVKLRPKLTHLDSFRLKAGHFLRHWIH